MGSSFSNPLDEAKQARMHEIISAFVEIFAKEFPVHYKDALIEEVKEAANGEEEDLRKLPDAPIPSYDLKIGFMTKRGDVVKNWKHRHFIAHNEEDNYRIDYYDKEGGALKGSVDCCGYSVVELSDEENSSFGSNASFGFKLVPDDDKRRCWYYSCDTEAEKGEWQRVIKNACRKANPPISPDGLVKKAFRSTYRAIRWHYGLYGSFNLTGSESEMLGNLCNVVVYRELIQEVLDNIPEDFTKKHTVAFVRKTVDTTVMAAVNAAWKSSLAACDSVKETIKSSASALLTPLFEQEKKLKDCVVEKVTGTTSPFLEDVGGRICSPIMNAGAGTIAKAYAAALTGFNAFMREKLKEGMFKENTFDRDVTEVQKSVECWDEGPLVDANKLCKSLHSKELDTVQKFFVGGASTYGLYSDVLEAIRDLAHRAVYAFSVAVKESGSYDGLEAVLQEVSSRFVFDAKLSQETILNGILSSVLQSLLETTVINPSLELTKPVQDTIDEIPVPGLSDLFNLTSLVEDCLQDIIDSGLSAVVTSSIGDLNGQIDAAAESINVTPAV